MIRLPSSGRAMVCLAALAAIVSWVMSDRPPAGQAGAESRQLKAIRLGSARWRIGDCNWLAYAADGKSVYACCATHRPGVQLGYSATDIIRQLDVRTGRQVQQFALPKVPAEPDIPGALDKRIAAVGWPCNWLPSLLRGRSKPRCTCGTWPVTNYSTASPTAAIM